MQAGRAHRLGTLRSPKLLKMEHLSINFNRSEWFRVQQSDEQDGLHHKTQLLISAEHLSGSELWN